jgi:glutamate-ammonia-ligase adenylyltransferase
VISSSPAFREKIEQAIRDVLTRRRDINIIANDVLEMRQAIADEKGDSDIWDMKYAAGGMIDIEFLAQYLQLIHAADRPEILSVSTVRVIENAVKLGILPSSDADVLRPAARLYHDLTQILRLCVSARFKPETAGEDLLRVMTRAGDAPDFSALEAQVRETQAEVRAIFLKTLEARPQERG